MSLPPAATVLELRRLVGRDAVFLQCKGKRPVAKGWPKLTSADMTPEYYSKLLRHNIGVSLGQASGGLCVIDCDEDAFAERLLESNPIFAGTLQTRGARGRSFWLRVQGGFPKSCKLTIGGRGVGEFRADGNQSIIHGTHPDTRRAYQRVVNRPVVLLPFDSIVWPTEIDKPPAEKLSENPVKESCQQGLSEVTVKSDCHARHNTVVGVSACVAAADVAVSSDARLIDEAIGDCLPSGLHQSNRASFKVCLKVLALLCRETFSEVPADFKRYLMDRWYDGLKARGLASKPKAHYAADLVSSMKKATVKAADPVPKAWALAQTNPLPAEARLFEDGHDRDQHIVSLIALCHELQQLVGDGWWVSTKKAASLIFGDEREFHQINEWFKVLIEYGVLEVIAPYEKGKKATTYRYVNI